MAWRTHMCDTARTLKNTLHLLNGPDGPRMTGTDVQTHFEEVENMFESDYSSDEDGNYSMSSKGTSSTEESLEDENPQEGTSELLQDRGLTSVTPQADPEAVVSSLDPLVSDANLTDIPPQMVLHVPDLEAAAGEVAMDTTETAGPSTINDRELALLMEGNLPSIPTPASPVASLATPLSAETAADLDTPALSTPAAHDFSVPVPVEPASEEPDTPVQAEPAPLSPAVQVVDVVQAQEEPAPAEAEESGQPAAPEVDDDLARELGLGGDLNWENLLGDLYPMTLDAMNQMLDLEL